MRGVQDRRGGRAAPDGDPEADAPGQAPCDGDGCAGQLPRGAGGDLGEGAGVSWFGRPGGKKRAQAGWQYLQVQKIHSGSRLVEVRVRVVFGEPELVRALLGEHTAYIERSHPTSRR
jgi:hypothetical protein